MATHLTRHDHPQVKKPYNRPFFIFIEFASLYLLSSRISLSLCILLPVKHITCRSVNIVSKTTMFNTQYWHTQLDAVSSKFCPLHSRFPDNQPSCYPLTFIVFHLLVFQEVSPPRSCMHCLHYNYIPSPSKRQTLTLQTQLIACLNHKFCLPVHAVKAYGGVEV
jgi:hypothetical protein